MNDITFTFTNDEINQVLHSLMCRKQQITDTIQEATRDGNINIEQICTLSHQYQVIDGISSRLLYAGATMPF